MIVTWLTTSQTLQDWSRTFYLAKIMLETGLFVTQEYLAAQKISMRNAQEYKTPKQKKFREEFGDKPPSPYEYFIPEKSDNTTAQAEAFMQHIGEKFLVL